MMTSFNNKAPFLVSLIFLLASMTGNVLAENGGYYPQPNYNQAPPGYGGYGPQQNSGYYQNYNGPYNGPRGNQGFNMPWNNGGPSFNSSGFNGPWNNNSWNNNSWNNSPWNSGGWNNAPWNGGWWGNNSRNNPFGPRGPGQWMNPNKQNMANNWEDMLNAPSRMGPMPGGWNAPSISVPNPIDVGDEFSDAARSVPNQMNNFGR